MRPFKNLLNVLRTIEQDYDGHTAEERFFQYWSEALDPTDKFAALSFAEAAIDAFAPRNVKSRGREYVAQLRATIPLPASVKAYAQWDLKPSDVIRGNNG